MQMIPVKGQSAIATMRTFLLPQSWFSQFILIQARKEPPDVHQVGQIYLTHQITDGEIVTTNAHCTLVYIIYYLHALSFMNKCHLYYF